MQKDQEGKVMMCYKGYKAEGRGLKKSIFMLKKFRFEEISIIFI